MRKTKEGKKQRWEKDIERGGESRRNGDNKKGGDDWRK